MTRPSVLYFASVFWDDPFGTPQQIARRLAARYDVLYVEPSVMQVYLRDPRRNRRWLRMGHAPRRLLDGLFVYTPPPTLPLKTRADWINSVSQRFLAPFVRRAARALGFSRPVVFTYLPHTWAALGRLEQRLACYYCVDDMGTLSSIINPSVVQRYERALLDRAQLVFTTSRQLLERLRRYHPSVHHVPNGCDPELYARALDPSLEIAPAIADMTRPVIGFSGALDFRLHQDLLAEVARRRPSWSFVFVGPVRADVTRLEALPNVRFVPQQPVEALPSYFKAFDVALVPYAPHPMVTCIYPAKLNEYLAAGLPVVTTSLPELQGMDEHLVRQADTADGFIAAIERALDEGDTFKPLRVAEGRRNSWEQRAATIAARIDERLGGQ